MGFHRLLCPCEVPPARGPDLLRLGGRGVPVPLRRGPTPRGDGGPEGPSGPYEVRAVAGLGTRSAPPVEVRDRAAAQRDRFEGPPKGERDGGPSERGWRVA